MEELKVVEHKDDKVVLSEVRTFEATARELRSELDGIAYRKQGLIEQSKQLKKEYDAVLDREKIVKSILADMENEEETDDFIEL